MNRHREPFFVAAGEAPAHRLLLISYHFPPGTAIGALRWQKLASLAAERGWCLDVITADPDELPARDEARLKELPAGTRVFGVGTPEPGWIRAERWLRRPRSRPIGAETLPAVPAGSPTRAPRASFVRTLARGAEALRWYARDGSWARAAGRVAAELVRERPYLACVTCGPPHMAHDAGRRLCRRGQLPFVMDLRDPWSLVERLADSMASPVWYALARGYERRAVAAASLVVMNTEPAARAMRARYPAAAGRIIAAPNGYDEEAVPTVPHGRTFVIAYAGTVYLDRDPRPLLRAAARVIRERHLTPDDLRIEFMGEAEAMALERMAAEEGVEGYVRRYPQGTRRAALEFMARASMLVSLYQDSHCAIPSKVYEYMLFDAWLLALADPGSATAELLLDTDAHVARPSDLDGIAAVIERRYAEHAAGLRPRRLATNPRLSRRAQAAALFDAIARVTSSFDT